jgi:pyridoxal phosphate enzyme (YggS family)
MPVTEPGTGLAEVEARIAAAARRAGRDAREVTLIAVTKTFAPDAIRPVLERGHRTFGENRVQEAQGKWPRLRESFAELKLHLIGPLQTNKVRDAVALFDAIHSVDRDSLAAALAKEMARQDRTAALFVQVNTGEEPQKAGVRPAAAAAFVARCRDQHRLRIEGLMCLPPLAADPTPHFDMLRQLAETLGLTGLSMGMSGDYETAIAHGATHVRIGSAIFGERQKSDLAR